MWIRLTQIRGKIKEIVQIYKESAHKIVYIFILKAVIIKLLVLNKEIITRFVFKFTTGWTTYATNTLKLRLILQQLNVFLCKPDKLAERTLYYNPSPRISHTKLLYSKSGFSIVFE